MENIYSEVAKRLKVLGVHYATESDYAIIYAADNAETTIKNETNLDIVPEGLKFVWVDMAAGYFLQEKKSLGQLKICGVDLSEAPAKSITEGDVSITFASASDGVKSPEARLDELIKKLINPPQSAYARFRRLQW
ncbi:MAG: hypothetical protein IJW86_07350 [Clostridia bacterium]|nr:hypothetical protein [Clostridia bacterium]